MSSQLTLLNIPFNLDFGYNEVTVCLDSSHEDIGVDL